jgi:hypothetical protein
MLLPDKHITLAESILGLGAFVLGELLERPQSIDRLYKQMSEASESPALPAYHDFDALILAIIFLYSVGALELTESGGLQLCVS